MNTGKSLFSQLMAFTSKHKFDGCVARYEQDYRVKKFTFWDQFLCMCFAQLTRRESLRDIEVCLRGLGSRCYHLGIRGVVSRSTLAEANERRDFRVFADYGRLLMEEAQLYYSKDELGTDLEQTVYALDSSNIDLCLSLFPWAQFDPMRAGLRLNALLNLRGNIPCFIEVLTQKQSELLAIDSLKMDPGSIYILDRGYFDWARLARFTRYGAFFVLRAKADIKTTRQKSLPVNKVTGIRSDQMVTPFSARARRNFPGALRRITYVDIETGRRFTFLTNNFLLPAEKIPELYKSRWQIELFFKWIKQHLKIKVYLGRSPNAVKIQIWTAISTYLLIAIAKKKLGLPHSLHTISQVLSLCAFHKTPLKAALSDSTSLNNNLDDEKASDQLSFWQIPTGQ